MRCKRVAKKGEDVKPVSKAPLADENDKNKKGHLHKISDWASQQVEENGIIALIDIVILLGSAFYGWKYAKESYIEGSTMKFVIKFSEWIAGLLRSLFGFS
jgi:hypothetical protein